MAAEGRVSFQAHRRPTARQSNLSGSPAAHSVLKNCARATLPKLSSDSDQEAKRRPWICDRIERRPVPHDAAWRPFP